MSSKYVGESTTMKNILLVLAILTFEFDPGENHCLPSDTVGSGSRHHCEERQEDEEEKSFNTKAILVEYWEDISKAECEEKEAGLDEDEGSMTWHANPENDGLGTCYHWN